MILQSENIVLRPIIESDFDKYFKWHLDEEIRFLAAIHPFAVTEKLEREWFEKVMEDSSNNRILFSIVHKSNDEVIGYFQLTNIDFISRKAFLGIVIGEKEFQGKGLGYEVLKLGLGYGFNYLGLEKISLDVIKNNEKALKLYKKIGFSTEGEFVKDFYFNGLYYSILRLAVFKEVFCKK